MKLTLVVCLMIMFTTLVGCSSGDATDDIHLDLTSGESIAITNIFDSVKLDSAAEGLATGDGFSALLETKAETLLIDTPYKNTISGDSRGGLLHNMELLGIEAADIDKVVITHYHADSALSGFMKVNPSIEVYATSETDMKNKVESLGGIYHEAKSMMKISDTVFSTGELQGQREGEPVDEHAVVVKMEEGLVIIVGCSHPDILMIVDTIKTQFPDEPILYLYGGLHLSEVDDEAIFEKVLQGLADRGVQRLTATRCSGRDFCEYATTFAGIEYIPSGVGVKVILD